ncbi:hypothetical protein RclHR1_10970002 [Rhizophagus clarus]|uniref:Uncharacterized protein n=1 Tax=Rhizophagus clarus TaxID=94130 RepID=A0A2Z6QHR5_9GLOM|nr:hypothetical protein RclHR1_10970002 [Rhizophagus clarus]
MYFRWALLNFGISEQNYAKTILVSAFQDEFLPEILARLHISKVWNTEHTGSDSTSKSRTSIRSRLKPELHFEANQIISKVRNSNSKWTEVFKGPKLHSEADYCPELHFEVQNSTSRQTIKSGTPLQGGPLSGTPFQGRLLSLELHFKAD